MNEKNDTIIAECLKSWEYLCIFEKCQLFKQCYPEIVAKEKELENIGVR